jgi:hypothetical protein
LRIAAGVSALSPGSLAACVVCLLLLAGCAKYAPETHVGREQLVKDYNDHAKAVDRLWARAKIRVSFQEPGQLIPLGWGSTSPLASPNGLLLLSETGKTGTAPDFVLIGRETLAVELFRLGSSVEQGLYYLWYKFGDRSGAWWGELRYAGAPCATDIPMDPTQLAAVLAVTDLPDEQVDIPAVTLRFTHLPGQKLGSGERPAYVLSYIDRQAVTNRIVARRDIYFPWSDDPAVPRRPYRIEFYDNDGHRRLVASLDDYKPVDLDDDTPAEDCPTMPSDIRLEWSTPEGGTNSMHIVLSEMTTADIWDVEAVDFSPAGIAPANIIRVDDACDELEANR